jgi:hypothetical protein
MAGVKVSWACIVIAMLIMSSGAASGEARRLMVLEEARTGGEACPGSCLPPVQGRAGLTVTAAKIATTDGRPTTPGHSPGIGNKIAGNTR